MIEEFPDRKSIIENKKIDSYQQSLVDQVKQLDITNVDFSSSDFKPRNKIVEKQKIYRWSRLFIKDELSDLKVNDVIQIEHLPTGEILKSVFICYAKKNLEKDSDGNIVTFDGDEDKKILCLMIDIEHLESDKVKFIRTLFQNTKWYEYQLMKRTELLFVNKRTDRSIDYYDVAF
jgi:hypothetical protein